MSNHAMLPDSCSASVRSKQTTGIPSISAAWPQFVGWSGFEGSCFHFPSNACARPAISSCTAGRCREGEGSYFFSSHCPNAWRPDDDYARRATRAPVDAVPVHARQESVLQPVAVFDRVVDLHELVHIGDVSSVLREVIRVRAPMQGMVQKECEEDRGDQRSCGRTVSA